MPVDRVSRSLTVVLAALAAVVPWAPGADLDDDVAELLGLGQSALGVDGELKLLTMRHGRLTDLPGCNLQVLL